METTSEFKEAVRATAAAFQRVGWKWDLPEEHVPTMREIRLLFGELLRDVIHDNIIMSATGRLFVSNDKELGGYSLLVQVGVIWPEHLQEVLDESAP